MSTSDAHSSSKFHINIKLSPEYATTRSKNQRMLRDAEEANRLRMEGKKHIDLWVDGSIYPRDPLTGRYPSFVSVHDIIRFVGDGVNGLLGYCSRLSQCGNEQVNHLLYLNTLVMNFQTQVLELQKKIETLEESNKKLKALNEESNQKLNSLKKTPIGMRERIKEQKHINKLSETCGGRKRRMKLTREYISQVSGLDMHKSEERVQILNETMNKLDVIKLLRLPENEKLRKLTLRELLKDMNSIVKPSQIVEACDSVGVSRRGYRTLSGLWFRNLKSKKFKPFGLPRPHNVSKIRHQMNQEIPNYFGEYYHIEGSMPYEKTKKKSFFEYNAYNNIWMDLKKVQIAMVQQYGITVRECDGNLKFVLKLDEAQILKCQKMERISISIMNRALDYSQCKRNEKGNKVQSEMEIWWIGSAQVPLESHDILKWLFSHTTIPSIMESQAAGEPLEVAGVGSFTVEWHLSADLKTIKSMFGMCGGANTKYPCIYCMAGGTGDKGWTKETDIGKPPSRNLVNLSKFPITDMIWNPILPIQLKNVHICTLHAEIRILDKLLRLHLDYAYSIKPSTLSDDCIEKCEDLLSKMGFHGGQVHLKKDPNLSGGTGDILQDVSMGGAKARRFLGNHDQKQVNAMWDCWKELCRITTNVSSQPLIANKRMLVWKNLDEFLKILRKQRSYATYATDFQNAIAALIKAIKDAWGEKDITHYLVRLLKYLGYILICRKDDIYLTFFLHLCLLQHILYIHGPYFAKTGPLATWSTQGMEKSHYQARTSYFRSTRHGGGQIRSNALKELYNWFYRRQLQRILAKGLEDTGITSEDNMTEQNIDNQITSEQNADQVEIETEQSNEDNLDQENRNVEISQ